MAGIGSEHLDGNGQLEILGKVDDLADYYSQIDIALAPIRLGGGVKVKIIEALMNYRPVLATRYALEGFPPDLASLIPVVSDIAPDFGWIAEGRLDGEKAFALARKYFSVETWSDTVTRLLDATTVAGVL